MRRIFWNLALIALLAALLPAAAPAVGIEPQPAAAQDDLDDELVILTANGTIVIQDPRIPDGIRPVTWQSTDAGWQNVATGDFNGDGTAEIIALRGNTATTFDPIVPPGSAAVPALNSVVANQNWEEVVTGDFDNDGRDEIVLTRTTSEGDSVERLVAYGLNTAGTAWSQLHTAAFGLRWEHLAAGDLDGDGSDEVAAIRHRLNPTERRVHIWDPNNNWSTYGRGDYSFRWLTVEIGNTHTDASGKDELVLTREGVLGELNSMLIFRWPGNDNLTDVTGERFFPYFFDVALGDINNSGDDEVFLLRNVGGTSSVALVMRNYGSDGAVPFETLAGASKWKKLHTGDVDGDDRAELIIMSADEYRIYTQPHANLNFTPYPGSYRSNGRFAVGNIDGTGVPEGPALLLSDLSFSFDLVAGETDTASVDITNSGDSSVIDWSATVTEGDAWLSVAPDTGVTPGTLSLNIDSAGLAAGSHTGTVRVDAVTPNVANSPQTIAVTLTVTPAPNPVLSLSGTSFDFDLESGETAATAVNITNSGNSAVIDWSASVTTGSSWLSVNPGTGVTPGTLGLAIDTRGLLAGSYTGRVRVEATTANVSNSPQTITVSLNVTAPPFSVDPSQLRWLHRQGTVADQRIVELFGPGITWYAGTVPIPLVPSLKEAIANDEPIQLVNGQWQWEKAGRPDDVDLVDWVTVIPNRGTATSDGSPVVISLVSSQVPRDYSKVAVVFIAEQTASPPTVIVELSILSYQLGDLSFVPSVLNGR